jgi:hypothetical protein
MEGMVPAQQSRSLSGWQRAGLACLLFANAVLSLWADGFHRFEWLPWLCVGLLYASFSETQKRQQGEPFLGFLMKPRTILVFALLIVGIAGFGRNLYLMYEKLFA